MHVHIIVYRISSYSRVFYEKLETNFIYANIFNNEFSNVLLY